MLKVYARRVDELPIVPLLHPNLGRGPAGGILFRDKVTLVEPLVQLVDDPSAADLIVIPHPYSRVAARTGYISEIVRLASQGGKRVLVFATGDSTDPVELPNAIVFRNSQYQDRLRPNEIMMPAEAEDLSEGRPAQWRERTETPTVGFCGFAGYRSFRHRMATVVKTLSADSVRRPGIAIRRRALGALRRSSLVETRFIVRNRYSAHVETAGSDPERLRREFVENLLASDLALSVKGDGNYSCRFYEALSLGRVPLLVDTGCVLPLRDRVPYDEFVLTVTHHQVDQIASRVSEFWQGMDAERYLRMQQKAREAFEKYLSIPAFLRHAIDLVSEQACESST